MKDIRKGPFINIQTNTFFRKITMAKKVLHVHLGFTHGLRWRLISGLAIDPGAELMSSFRATRAKVRWVGRSEVMVASSCSGAILVRGRSLEERNVSQYEDMIQNSSIMQCLTSESEENQKTKEAYQNMNRIEYRMVIKSL